MTEVVSLSFLEQQLFSNIVKPYNVLTFTDYTYKIVKDMTKRRI